MINALFCTGLVNISKWNDVSYLSIFEFESFDDSRAIGVGELVQQGIQP